MKKQNFFRGALVLTAGMALVKLIGALFKIPLKYAVGEYGMGLFNVAYNFYGPVFSLATAGFPAAVARLVSEERALGRWNDVRRVRRVALPLFLAFGGGGMLLITLGAPFYCIQVIEEPNALAPVLALGPAILFSCLASVYRGYTEGLQDMTPTAVSQVAEALVKLCVGLGLSLWVVSSRTAEYAARGTVFSIVPEGKEAARLLILSFAAAGAVLGVTAGAAVSALCLTLGFRRAGGDPAPEQLKAAPAPRGKRETAKRLLAVTLPIAVGAVATNLAGLIDATFLQNRLAGLAERDAPGLLARFPGMIPALYLENPASIPTFLYGCYTLAMTVYLLVPSLTQALAVSALPAVTEAHAGGDRVLLRERLLSVNRVTALFCFPAGLGLTALAEPIVRLLYGEDPSAPIIAGALEILGTASLAAALCAPLSSMLQGVGRADLPVKLLLPAVTIKLLVNWFLCGQARWNITGAAAGTLLCYLFFAAAQFIALGRVTGLKLPVRRIFPGPLFCAACCGLSARIVHALLFRTLSGTASWMQKSLILTVSILAGGIIYLLLLLLFGILEKNDLKLLPGGQKIAKTLENSGWI